MVTFNLFGSLLTEELITVRIFIGQKYDKTGARKTVRVTLIEMAPKVSLPLLDLIRRILNFKPLHISNYRAQCRV